MTGTAPLARRTLLTGALASTGALLVGPGAAARTIADTVADVAPTSAARRPVTWVPSWATAHTRPTAADPLVATGVTDRTVRHVLRLSAGTTPGGRGRLRVRLAGTFSAQPVLVGAVTVARRAPGLSGAGPGVAPGTVTPVTFGGQSGGLLAAGATLVSDPVPFSVPDGGDLVVSLHLPGPTGPLSIHRNLHATGYVAAGDRTSDAGDGFTTGDAAVTRSAVLLCGVDVERPGAPGVAVLGDSITEGVGTPDDADQRLTDHLARRLARRGGPVGVANLGISGNRVLLDDERFGPSGQARLDRDALALPGTGTLLVVLGVNDLQQPPSQTDPEIILAGYRQLVLRARDQGLRVVGTTITPFGGWQRWTPALEGERRYVNAALLADAGSGRPGVFDAVADVASALADPADPARLQPAYDSGDGLHPSPAGADAMAAAIGRRTLLG
ncbi:GDSL-type esterase/lipase family protein [Promicromonospora kroppenstedtii]|uniref:GDSL-type esterase/lipase family protein n=1 Tax=Promicromonospora kroppenstedtii TaxID=440482 RepID=A0ABW7XE95_9MICO